MTTGPSTALADSRCSGRHVPRRVDDREPAGSPPTSPASRPGSDDLAAPASLEISNAMVQLYKQAFGRGPTKARTAFPGPDMVLVLLEDGFTAAERTLLALGEIDALRQPRLVVQEALEKRARSVVESVLGRQTLAFITSIDPRRELAINLFTLKPAAVADDHRDAATGRGQAP